MEPTEVGWGAGRVGQTWAELMDRLGYSRYVAHPDPSSYAGKFSGPYSHRTIEGGIGHNLPQEAPKAFADAVLEVAHDG